MGTREHAADDARTADAPRPRVALAHDWLVGMRGGERVLDRFARVIADRYEPAGLSVMFDDHAPHTPAIDAMPKTVSRLGRVPGASGRARRWLLPLYPRAVDDLSRAMLREHAPAPIDLVVSTSSAAVKNLRPPEGVPHLCYCHAPARYLWSRTGDYAGSRARALGLRAFGGRLRAWDRAGSKTVTTFLANSTHIAAEIARVYDRDAAVLHPPARTGFFTPDRGVQREDFWLLAGAIEPYKRADLAVRAATASGARLIVAGAGSELTKVRALAREIAPAGQITFEGRVSDERLRELYRKARALVHPQVEDFGIIAVEAQACGCPVVALRAGGALDTVVEGETGAFFDDPDPASIARAVDDCPSDPGACRRNAERFSEDRFDDEIATAIERALGGDAGRAAESAAGGEKTE